MSTTGNDAVAGPASASRTLELRRGESAKKVDAAVEAGIARVAEGFDALFGGILVGELTRPLQAAGFGGSGPGSSVIQGMIETHLSDHLSKGGGLGVGRMVADTMRRFLEGAARTEPQEADAKKDATKDATKDAKPDATAAIVEGTP